MFLAIDVFLLGARKALLGAFQLPLNMLCERVDVLSKRSDIICEAHIAGAEFLDQAVAIFGKNGLHVAARCLILADEFLALFLLEENAQAFDNGTLARIGLPEEGDRKFFPLRVFL